jgi:hypothetical protein
VKSRSTREELATSFSDLAGGEAQSKRRLGSGIMQDEVQSRGTREDLATAFNNLAATTICWVCLLWHVR